ncbi:hypothetical protein ACFL96_17330 [Thermoproteota archaeon]
MDFYELLNKSLPWIGSAGVVLVIIISVYAIIISRKRENAAEDNLKLAARIINAQVEKKFLGLRRRATSYYKGRKVTFYLVNASKYNPVRLAADMFPHNIVKPQKKFVLVSEPKPSTCTVLSGKTIYYGFPFDTSVVIQPLFKEQDIIDGLEKLTQAAGIVESGAPYFKD